MEGLISLLFSLGILPVIIGVMFLASAIRILKEYERGVIFRFGRLSALKGPGLNIIIPMVDKLTIVDIRTITLEVPPQEVITRDNVTIKVNAVVFFNVMDARKAITQVENYWRATLQIAQTTLRNVLGQSELDDMLAERDKINLKLQKIIDEQTEPWGIKVSVVEIKDVELPETLKRAMAKQAEAEREKRAKIIHAEGELQASDKLTQAAAIIGREPTSIQLRYLQTLTEIAVEKNSTILFPVPLELLRAFTSSNKP